jgi:hypothetical protein
MTLLRRIQWLLIFVMTLLVAGVPLFFGINLGLLSALLWLGSVALIMVGYVQGRQDEQERWIRREQPWWLRR